MRLYAGSLVKEGTTPEEIDRKVHEMCVKNDFYPAALDYKKFPKSVSISVNEVACHGIPDTRPFEVIFSNSLKGDIVKIDCMSFFKEYFGDCCGTFTVGEVPPKIAHLVESAKECLESALKICGPGTPFSEIGNVIEFSKTAKLRKLNVIEEYAGHCIGKNLHDNPLVLHYANSADYGLMKPGMAFTLEPILTTGDGDCFVWPDKWTVVTKDGEPCAQFEEMVLVTENGVDVLTRTHLMEEKSQYLKK